MSMEGWSSAQTWPLVATVALMTGCGKAEGYPCTAAPTVGSMLSVGGISFPQRSVTALEFKWNSEDPLASEEIIFSAAEDACAEYEAGRQGPSTTEWRLLDIYVNGPGEGSYCVKPLAEVDPSCAMVRILVRPPGTPPDSGPSNFVDAESGTVELTTVAPDRIAGSYDVQFTTGEQVAASFDAPTCNVGPCSGG
jgi:hypothetical protein